MARFRGESDKNIALGVQIQNRTIRIQGMKLELMSSLWVPYLYGRLTVDTASGAVAELTDFVVGAEVAIAYSGGQDFEEAFTLSFNITGIQIEDSHVRTAGGMVVINIVSRWAYQEKGLPPKVYKEVENPDDIIQGELTDIGMSGALSSYREPEPLDRPRNFYRVGGTMEFMHNRVIPWLQSPDETAYFWYSTLDGEMHFHTAKDMFAQETAAFLAPEGVFYPYDEDIPGYAYTSRSYRINPKRTDLFHVKAAYFAEGEQKDFLEDGTQDTEGVAIQIQRDTGVDEMRVWYVGHRSEQEMRAHAAYLRRDHLFHQVHVLLFENELEIATFLRPGTIVRMYDLNTYIPENADSPQEEMIESNMSNEYVVASSALIFEGRNEEGFRGSKLEIVKLGYNTSDLDRIDNLSAYVEV